MSLASTLPAFVPLALGSAYFRSQHLPEAEKAYKMALQIDPRIGEAWSNLAVLYMMSDRLRDADEAVKNAEKAGFTVNENLKNDIKKKKNGG